MKEVTPWISPGKVMVFYINTQKPLVFAAFLGPQSRMPAIEKFADVEKWNREIRESRISILAVRIPPAR
jgi:hypothetical protein